MSRRQHLSVSVMELAVVLSSDCALPSVLWMSLRLLADVRLSSVPFTESKSLCNDDFFDDASFFDDDSSALKSDFTVDTWFFASPKLPLLTSLISLLTESLKASASLHTAACCDFDALLLPPLLPQAAPTTAIRTMTGTRANDFRRMTGSPRSDSATTHVAPRFGRYVSTARSDIAPCAGSRSTATRKPTLPVDEFGADPWRAESR